jgi:hypothetical protein
MALNYSSRQRLGARSASSATKKSMTRSKSRKGGGNIKLAAARGASKESKRDAIKAYKEKRRKASAAKKAARTTAAKKTSTARKSAPAKTNKTSRDTIMTKYGGMSMMEEKQPARSVSEALDKVGRKRSGTSMSTVGMPKKKSTKNSYPLYKNPYSY